MHAGAGFDVRPFAVDRPLTSTPDGSSSSLTAITDLDKAGYDVLPGYLSITLGVTFFR